MPRGLSKPIASPSRAASRPSAVWLNVILAGVLGSAATFALTPSRFAPHHQRHPTTSAANFNFANLLKMPDEALAQSDFALLNLQCAADLPGSENLDADALLATLDNWVIRIKFDTDRHLHRFRQNPAEYEDSEQYYRMLMMTTVIQQDLGVRYNPERARNPDFRDSSDLFIHGLLGEKRAGTCASMPVLSVALGRRLGYPLTLAQARSHLYVRWELGGGKHLNFEATSLGLTTKPDEHYANWPEPLSKSEMTSGAFLRPLTPREELAVFLQMRGHCLEDNGRLAEAQVAYALAHQLFPSYPYALPFLADAVRANLDRSPMFARRTKRVPPRRPAPEELLRLADELNAQNAQTLSQWHHPASADPIWPAMNPSGGMP